MEKKRIFFLFGGSGDEHDVSLATAKSALPAFSNEFIINPVFITKDTKWVYLKGYSDPQDAWQRAESVMAAATTKAVPADVALNYIEQERPYVVFIGLHGRFGEDGTLQALLEAEGIPYTGSDSEASALAIDKPRVLQILQDEGLATPEFLEVTTTTSDSDIQEFAAFHGYPLVVLPAESGSSVGVSLVRKPHDLGEALKQARQSTDRVMLSQYIAGREFSAGVLVTGKNELTALPPTEIVPGDAHDFWDYEAKYVAGEAQEITPPDVNQETIQRIQALAKRVHQLVEADGYSRTDMIMTDQGKIHILEINTLPGLTPTSVLPQQAKAHGLSFSELLTTICMYANRESQDYLTYVDPTHNDSKEN